MRMHFEITDEQVEESMDFLTAEDAAELDEVRSALTCDP